MGKIKRVRKPDRRLFIYDTEACTFRAQHVITHICLAELDINYTAGEFKIVRWFQYDYNDDFPMPERMRQKLGGIAGFLIDMVKGTFSNSVFLAHNASSHRWATCTSIELLFPLK